MGRRLERSPILISESRRLIMQLLRTRWGYSMICLVVLAVLLAGAVGGIVNALMTENGFIFPSSVQQPNGPKIWRPGILGNALVSAVAALISWGLYGADAAYNIFSTSNSTYQPTFTPATLVGAVLIGIGGARWLTAEVDKKLLRGAAVAAASKNVDQPLAAKMAISTPLQALREATK